MKSSLKFSLIAGSITVVLWCAAVIGVKHLVPLPDIEPPELSQIEFAQQNWPKDFSLMFHHTAQGSELLPYDWLLALEQPDLGWSLFAQRPLLVDPAYLARFGFLASPRDAQYNPDGLPVGFARDERWTDPKTGKQRLMAGLTCSACHTGQLEFTDSQGKLRALRIDGGAAMVDLQRFEMALGVSAVLTRYWPGRFERFARNVLKERYNETSRQQLKTEFSAFVDKGLHEIALNRRYQVYPHSPGYGRVDALNRIGNQVFGLEVKQSNLAPADAPVAFPHLWGASWFDFVQYNGSVPQPLVRNVGEALGVRTPFVGRGAAQDLYKSSVHVDNLRLMEIWLAGAAPYEGLQAPQWPEHLLGAINQPLAAEGKILYQQYCQSCHLPDPQQLKQDRLQAEPQYWTAKNFRGDRLLQLKLIPLSVIGTDPKQAQDFATRKVDTGDLGLGSMLAGAALDQVSIEVTRRYFRDNQIAEDEQLNWNQGHKLGAEAARVELAYKARPLDGVWATPPFLHNGSVPSLYALLSPVAERPLSFSLASRRFDPKTLGYSQSELSQVERFDTQIPGNSNAGHQFTNQSEAVGRIGPLLTESQRYALLEYLKTL